MGQAKRGAAKILSFLVSSPAAQRHFGVRYSGRGGVHATQNAIGVGAIGESSCE